VLFVFLGACVVFVLFVFGGARVVFVLFVFVEGLMSRLCYLYL